MINKKEIFSILTAALAITISVSLFRSWESILYSFITVFLIIAVNIAAKKTTSYYLDSEIETKLWEIKRYGIKPHRHFKKPFPAGAFFPILSKLILFPFKSFAWMASLIFDVKPKVYRAAKRHEFYSFSEMTENHIGLIASAGIFANIIVAIITYFLGFTEFTKISIYYTFFNMLPISNLDGNKIFFGNIVIWGFLASLVLLGMLFIIFTI